MRASSLLGYQPSLNLSSVVALNYSTICQRRAYRQRTRHGDLHASHLHLGAVAEMVDEEEVVTKLFVLMAGSTKHKHL